MFAEYEVVQWQCLATMIVTQTGSVKVNKQKGEYF
jgi:hypothetical protein